MPFGVQSDSTEDACVSVLPGNPCAAPATANCIGGSTCQNGVCTCPNEQEPYGDRCVQKWKIGKPWSLDRSPYKLDDVSFPYQCHQPRLVLKADRAEAAPIASMACAPAPLVRRFKMLNASPVINQRPESCEI